MKLPRPTPEPSVEDLERALKRRAELAGAHRGDAQLYAEDHQKLNELLTLREQRIGTS